MVQLSVCHKAKHGCIIMASGMGTRFGSNKLMAELDGVPLIQHVIRATDGLFARRVVVTRHAEVAEVCHALGVEVILHDEPLRNDTVRLGMEGMDGCATVTFAQADQPLISAKSIMSLLSSAEDDLESIWRVSFEGTPGAPVVFPAWTFDELRTLPLGKGGGYVAKAHKERMRIVEVASKWELFDVDTVEDLQTLRLYCSQGKGCHKAG